MKVMKSPPPLPAAEMDTPLLVVVLDRSKFLYKRSLCRASSGSAVAQNNPYMKETYFGVAYSGLLVIYIFWLVCPEPHQIHGTDPEHFSVNCVWRTWKHLRRKPAHPCRDSDVLRAV